MTESVDYPKYGLSGVNRSVVVSLAWGCWIAHKAGCFCAVDADTLCLQYVYRYCTNQQLSGRVYTNTNDQNLTELPRFLTPWRVAQSPSF